MSPYDPAIHHRRSIRLRRFDYTRPASFFLTLCVEARRQSLGEIAEGRVVLSPIGQIVEEVWRNFPGIRPYVELDAFVVMPNHFHGILTFKDMGATRWVAPTPDVTPAKGPPARSIGAIVGQFKSVVTKRVRGLGDAGFGWQRNYYEHVVRDEYDLRRIREYIRTNPERWTLDRENPDRTGEDEFDLWLASIDDRSGIDMQGRPDGSPLQF